jgi:hypothetical protein
MSVKNKFKSVAFAVTALAAGSANAAIVTQWTVGVSAAFLPGSIVATDGSPGSVAISNSDKTLRWGESTGFGQSGLDVTNSPVNTIVDTGVSPVMFPPVGNVFVTHTNQPITGDTLDKVTLRSTLTLTPLVPALPGLPSASHDFLIDFLETPNGDDPCANGGSNGSGVNSDGCGDIFVIGNNALNFSFFYDTDGAGGDDPQQYFISFVEVTSGLNALPAAACLSATGSNAPCLGFVTPEKANTTFQFGAIITTEPVVIIPPPQVPEPGVLGLIGLGLVTLAGLRRRRT